jgi:hypothetical protein
MKYLIIILLLVSCSPVKQVLKDPAKLDEVAQEVIRRGYCVNDTTIITEIKDSVIYRDSIIEKVERIPCKDFDTTIGRARISVSSGVLKYSAKDSIVYRNKITTNTVRDVAYERILLYDVRSLKDTLVTERAAMITLSAEYKAYKLDSRIDRAKLWLLIVAIGIFALRKQISSVWRFFM